MRFFGLVTRHAMGKYKGTAVAVSFSMIWHQQNVIISKIYTPLGAYKSYYLTSYYIFLWCNGSTSDSGSEDSGSNPFRKTNPPV